MSVAHSQNEIKSKSLVELAEQLEAEIREAAREGKSLYEMEKDIFGRALQIGHAAIEQVLALQGDGDLGESIVTADDRRLKRSEEPAQRPLRTVFGEHTIRAYVYAAGDHEAIALRPVDARLSLPPGKCSYFFEEFSQYFGVDQAFGQASQGLATVLRQEVSVNLLERINRRMGEQAEGFLHVTARFSRICEDPDGEAWESNGTIEAFCWADEQIDARRRAGQKVLRLMDGQASLWDAADNCLSVPPEDTINILDILHVSSYVWRAAKVFYPREARRSHAL